MALKSRPRNKRSKRFENVVDNSYSKSEGIRCSSTESESDDSLTIKKVRDDFPIKHLMKCGENFKVDGDHIYSCGKSRVCSVINGKKRKISETSDDKPSKQKSCSKNALMARINRERKKKYIMSLETENNDLRKKNDDIKEKIDVQNKAIAKMKQEILYLKGLIANSKELSQILQNLKAATNLPITSSIINCREDTSYIEDCMSDTKAKTKTVSDGFDFPIVDKDINLSSSSDKSFSLSNTDDIESYGFNFENDCFDNYYYETAQDSIFNFNLSNTESEEVNTPIVEEACRSDAVGICLHVNNKRVSVEICSICNEKANLSC